MATPENDTGNTGTPINNDTTNYEDMYSEVVMSSAEMEAAAGNTTTDARSKAKPKLTYEDLQIQVEAPWPPPVFMKKNMPFEQRFYLENRWYGQWQFYDDKAGFNKKWYFRLQFTIVVFSVVVPVLVGFGPSLATAINKTFPDADVRTVIDILTVLLSLMVAVAAAVEGLFAYGDNWRTYRQAAEDLTQEKFMYDVGASYYAGAKNPFAVFVERCEDIIAQQNGRWVQKTQQNQAALAAANEELLDQYTSENQDFIADTFDERREITRTEREADGSTRTIHGEMTVSHTEPEIIAEAPAPVAEIPAEFTDATPIVPNVAPPTDEVAIAPDVVSSSEMYVAPDEYAVSPDEYAVAPDDYAVAPDVVPSSEMYVAPDEYAVADGADVASEFVASNGNGAVADDEFVAG